MTWLVLRYYVILLIPSHLLRSIILKWWFNCEIYAAFCYSIVHISLTLILRLLDLFNPASKTLYPSIAFWNMQVLIVCCDDTGLHHRPIWWIWLKQMRTLFQIWIHLPLSHGLYGIVNIQSLLLLCWAALILQRRQSAKTASSISWLNFHWIVSLQAEFRLILAFWLPIYSLSQTFWNHCSARRVF